MMRLKMLLDTAKKWWKPENGTVTILDLIWARLLDKLSTGLMSILYHVGEVTSTIRRAASEIQYQAKAIINRRTLEQINPIEYEWSSNNHTGFMAQTIGPAYGYYNTAVGSQAGHSYQPNNVQFNSSGPKTVLTITGDGDVIWTGKPSEAADILVRSFQMSVEDAKGVTKAARRRYYALACRNILSKAEDMEYEEFLAFLNREVYNRERKVILDSLKGEDNAT